MLTLPINPNRQMKDLFVPDWLVCLHLNEGEDKTQFIAEAEYEGFTWTDGARMTDHIPADLVILHQNMTVENASKEISQDFYHPVSSRTKMLRVSFYHFALNYYSYEYQPEESLSRGSATVLVKDDYETLSTDFAKYLVNEGFKVMPRTGWCQGVNWVFINLNNKRYAPGRPGIGYSVPIGDHAVTIDEFKTIYNIYHKYEGKRTLDM